jgi:V/A-type H+-transporting ATPase subunit C
MDKVGKSYNYAIGSVSVLSLKLLQKDKFIRLAECGSLVDALKLLNEFGYRDNAPIDRLTDFETMLDGEWQNVIAFVRQVSAEPDSTDCFILPVDFNNAKILMKAKYNRSDEFAFLQNYGLIDIETMKKDILQDDYSNLPTIMANACERIDKLFYEGNRKPSVIDNMLDKAYYRTVDGLLKKPKNKTVRDYFAAEIDGKNITLFFRLRKKGFSAEMFSSLYLPHGTISSEPLVSVYGKSDEEVKNAFKTSGWGDVVNKAVDEMQNGSTLAETEVLCEKHKRDILIEHKNDTDGIVPLVVYLLAKRTEIENLRLVLICLKNKTAQDKIITRLRELYV